MYRFSTLTDKQALKYQVKMSSLAYAINAERKKQGLQNTWHWQRGQRDPVWAVASLIVQPARINWQGNHVVSRLRSLNILTLFYKTNILTGQIFVEKSRPVCLLRMHILKIEEKSRAANSKLIRGVASIYARTPVRTAEIWEKFFSH